MTTPSGPPLGPPPLRTGQVFAVAALALGAVEWFAIAAAYNTGTMLAVGLFGGCLCTGLVIAATVRLVREAARRGGSR